MTPYNAYWATSKTFRNKGKLWTEEEKEQLRRMFCAGDKIETICEFLERPPEGVKAKLVAEKLIVEAEPTSEDYHRPDYYINPKILPANPAFPARSSISEEHPMKNIEQITLIDGQDASTLTDTQIFQKIAKLEKDMAMWKTIENRPVKLTKAIAALQLDIDALVAYVDGR